MLPIHCRLVNTQSSFDCSAVHYVYVNILHFGFVDDVILAYNGTGNMNSTYAQSNSTRDKVDVCDLFSFGMMHF